MQSGVGDEEKAAKRSHYWAQLHTCIQNEIYLPVSVGIELFICHIILHYQLYKVAPKNMMLTLCECRSAKNVLTCNRNVLKLIYTSESSSLDLCWIQEFCLNVLFYAKSRGGNIKSLVSVIIVIVDMSKLANVADKVLIKISCQQWN